MADAYENVAKNPLKLKGGLPGAGKVHKKKKKKDKDRALDKAPPEVVAEPVPDGPKGKTEAQRKFLEAQRQRELDRIKKKANLTHKEKVESLNKYLDNISEHYDIPKVSWTK